MIIEEGEVLKKGYGVAWRECHRRTLVVYLVPFNLIARWGRDIWILLIKPGKKNYLDQLYIDAYEKGYRNGRKTGEEWGTVKGRISYIKEIREAAKL